jgi:glycosyltransferase involved in cell wall biosynthesis
MVESAAAADSRIQYLGYLPFEETLKLYAQASVLVCMRITKKINTKYFFPSKVMEYLASGVPVICTALGGTETEYENLLYVLPDETAHALAATLRRVAQTNPEERLDKANKTAAYIATMKNWDAQGKRVADYIHEYVLTARP